MSKTNSFIGQIDILALRGARLQQVDGQECIVIPVNENPTIYPFVSRNGQPKAHLELFFRETSGNQYGNTHFIKSIVGKTNREKFGISPENLQQYTPILGNMKPYEGKGQSTGEGTQSEGFNGF